MTTTLTADLDLLLHKLSSDDGFRERLMYDPVATLDSIGVQLAAHEIPACVRLPSKQTVARDRMAIMDKLDNSAGAIPFFLTGKD